MLSKTIAAFTVLAALGVGALVSKEEPQKKTGIVEVIELEWHVADEETDCEIAVTPSSATLVKGGDNC